MKTFKKFWTGVKRNPVINAFIVAVLMQLFQDWQANTIDWPHFWGYLFTLSLSIMARSFTVPAKEHEEKVLGLHVAIQELSETKGD